MSMNIAIAGASGRMGTNLIEAVLASAETRLAVALDIKGGRPSGRTPAHYWARRPVCVSVMMCPP